MGLGAEGVSLSGCPRNAASHIAEPEARGSASGERGEGVHQREDRVEAGLIPDDVLHAAVLHVPPQVPVCDDCRG